MGAADFNELQCIAVTFIVCMAPVSLYQLPSWVWFFLQLLMILSQHISLCYVHSVVRSLLLFVLKSRPVSAAFLAIAVCLRMPTHCYGIGFGCMLLLK